MVILLHGSALIILIPLTFPPIVQGLILKGSMALLIIANVIHTIRYHVLLRGHPLHRCELYQDKIFLTHANTEARILPDSYAHPQLVILRVRLSDYKTCSLIIFPDALDTATFRRLRIHLRHFAQSD